MRHNQYFEDESLIPEQFLQQTKRKTKLQGFVEDFNSKLKVREIFEFSS